MSALKDVLQGLRNTAQTERDKGTAFERLALAFFKNDPSQRQQFEDAWSYEEWAGAQGIDRRDVGIDLVAKLAGEDAFCAIQCKFFEPTHRVQKGEIDSFFTAAGKKYFSRGIIVDTTDGNWSETQRMR